MDQTGNTDNPGQKREIHTADAVFRIAVEETDDGWVAFERHGKFEATGDSAPDAIANYAREIEHHSTD